MFNISVIIPSHNRAGLLPRALDSVLAQSQPVAQIIVIDDGSTDHTAQLLAGRYPRVDYIRQPNRGVSAAKNAGLARARHEWLCLLDSDDSWRADKLEKQVQAPRQNPAFRFCHTDETQGLFTLFSPRLPESVLRSGKAEGARCSQTTRATDSAFVPDAALPPASMQASARLDWRRLGTNRRGENRINRPLRPRP